MKFSEKLKEMNACPEAIDWVGDRTEAEAWAECERANWMIWYAMRKIKRQKVVAAICSILRAIDILQYIRAVEPGLLQVISAAEEWASKPTKKNRERAVDLSVWALSAGAYVWYYGPKLVDPRVSGDVFWAVAFIMKDAPVALCWAARVIGDSSQHIMCREIRKHLKIGEKQLRREP